MRGSIASPVSPTISPPNSRARARSLRIALRLREARSPRKSSKSHSRRSASGTAGGPAISPAASPQRESASVQKVTCQPDTPSAGRPYRPLRQCRTALLLDARPGEAPPGGRRERHGRLQLWIIAPAGPLPRLRPVPVEDVLALAVPLGIERHHRDRHLLGPGDEMPRNPAAAPPDRARGLERQQEPVGGEGIDRAARPPRSGRRPRRRPIPPRRSRRGQQDRTERAAESHRRPHGPSLPWSLGGDSAQEHSPTASSRRLSPRSRATPASPQRVARWT